MGVYTDPPLTASTLATRLARSRFNSRADLHPLVVKDALIAAKQLARRRVKRVLPESMKSLLPSTHNSVILDQLYVHPAVTKLVPELAIELFLMEPRPPLHTALNLLQTTKSQSKSSSLYYMVLRTELRRENFVAAFAIVDRLEPLPLYRVLGTSLACNSLGALSAWLWSCAPPVSAMLAVFWVLLGWPRNPSFTKVMWQQSGVPWLDQLRRTPQLHMANQIMQYYEDIRGVTVDNFHVHASRPQDPALERDLNAALNRLGMELRPSYSTQLYADYWSEQGYDFGNLEWQEPDQDPVDLEHEVAAQPPRHNKSL